MRCEGTTQNGLPCSGGAQRGFQSCPSHRLQVDGVPKATRHCEAKTKAGQACQAGAARDSPTCPQHKGRAGS